MRPHAHHPGPGGRRRHGGKRPGHKGRRGRGRLFGAGELRLALLDLLSQGPAHGYELMQRLAARTDGRYEPSAGATYPILQQLVDEDLARVEAVDGKKVYQVTPAGKVEVTAAAETLADIWHRAARWRQWSDLDEPGLRELGELRELYRTVIHTLQHGDADEQVYARVRGILARAIEEIHGV